LINVISAEPLLLQEKGLGMRWGNERTSPPALLLKERGDVTGRVIGIYVDLYY